MAKAPATAATSTAAVSDQCARSSSQSPAGTRPPGAVMAPANRSAAFSAGGSVPHSGSAAAARSSSVAPAPRASFVWEAIQ